MNDSKQSAIISKFRCSDAGLGNRAPLPDGRRQKNCFLCEQEGIWAKNNEVHLIMDCPSLANERLTTGIQLYRNLHRRIRRSMTSERILAMYLGGDEPSVDMLWERAKALDVMQEAWKHKIGLNY